MMRVVGFLAFCKAGKASATECHLRFMTQNSSPFARDFFGTQKEPRRLLAYCCLRLMHQIFPDPDRRTSDHIKRHGKTYRQSAMVWMRVVHRWNQSDSRFPFLDLAGNRDR